MGWGVSPHRGFCGCCVSAVKWIPVLVISGILVWSYYAYVVYLCILTIQSIPERSVLLCLYHLVFILFLWSYWRTVWTKSGSVPKKFRLSAQELDGIEGSGSDEEQRRLLEQIVVEKDLPVAMRTIQGAVRYCEKCCLIKPDRSHHCSVCGDCVLKMDHHCPWVNNCVAFNNYKFFVLFLLYGLVYCLYVALSSLKYFIIFWTDSKEVPGGRGKFHILFLFFVSSMFSISLCSLLGYHIHLVLKNRTTLEAFRAPVFRHGPDKEGFSLGKMGNFVEIFGDDWKKSFFPVFSSFGDGLTYPLNNTDEEQSYDRDDRQDIRSGRTGTRTYRRDDWEKLNGGDGGDEENVPMLGGQGDNWERWSDVGGSPHNNGIYSPARESNLIRDESYSDDSDEEVIRTNSSHTVETIVPKTNSVEDFVSVTIDS